MLSRVANRVSKQVRLTQLANQGFKATTVADASKKPSIGDAVTILQSKVSQINQVVSFNTRMTFTAKLAFVRRRKCPVPMRRLTRGAVNALTDA